MTQDTSVADRAHHTFGPSKMEYLNQCSAYEPGEAAAHAVEAADEGTMLHGIMEKLVAGVTQGRCVTERYETLMAMLAATVTGLTDDQHAAVAFCCREIDTLLAQAQKPVKILLEPRLTVHTSDGQVLNHGYADLILVYPNIAFLYDYKFGYVPVPPAEDNLQGLNYALGFLQDNPHIHKVVVKFIQPRLNTVTKAIYDQGGKIGYLQNLGDIIARAEYVRANPDNAQPYMAVGPYCSYCGLALSCAVLANTRGAVAAKIENAERAGDPLLPAPFPRMELASPEQWAVARYWVQIIETKLEEFKQRATEVAKANGNELRGVLPDGREVVYVIKETSVPRVLGPTVEIAEVLKDYLTPEEIYGAAKLSLGKLTEIAAAALIANADRVGEKLTKKAAVEQVESLLTVNGLLSSVDTKISYLKLQK